MTDRIAEIKARLQALPSEPEWDSDIDASIDDVGVRARNYVARAYPRTHEIDHKEGHIAAEAAQADAAFIASAPADMRYLLDEVERLLGLMKRIEDETAPLSDATSWHIHELARRGRDNSVQYTMCNGAIIVSLTEPS